MNVTTNEIPDLACRVVLAVSEERCDVRQGGVTTTVGFARGFPTPRIERVAPGNLVAVADAGQGAGVLVWRWYDAVVLGEQGGAVRLWEPFHGEVLARPRPSHARQEPGTRAYLSAGLPGADWWVCGPVTPEPADARVDLAEVAELYRVHGLWGSLT
ncbi:MAG: hypothetical protein U0R80_07465 [Nocardioidaceae bacterium]